jgi:hypothetical protein
MEALVNQVSERTIAKIAKATAIPLSFVSPRLLQRTCACGKHAMGGISQANVRVVLTLDFAHSI